MIEQNIPIAATPETQSPEYIEKMVAKAEGREPVATPQADNSTNTPAANTDEQPKKYAGKYESIEALEAGYLELQKAFSKKAAAPAAPATSAAPAQAAATESSPESDAGAATEATAEEQAAAALEAQGLDIQVYTSEFAEKGELSAESYEALAKAGIPQEVVDAYIAGQQLIADQMVNKVYTTVGGQDEYNKMMLWAKDALNAQQKAAYQAALDTNDINTVMLAVKGLQADYKAIKGTAPALVEGAQAATTAGEVYASLAEMKADMRDPRYHRDPAYRQRVAEKLGRSNVL